MVSFVFVRFVRCIFVYILAQILDKLVQILFCLILLMESSQVLVSLR